MKKIIITGGSGFIGAHLVKHIHNNTDSTILNIDKLTYAANPDSLAHLKESNRYHFEQIDITDREGTQSIFEAFKPNLVMHLAAESHVDNSIDSPDEFIKTNIIGTYNLLETSRHYLMKFSKPGKNNFKFHHISTDEVFGDLPHPDLSEEIPMPTFKEETPYNPSSPYSASKASSDHLVRAWHRTYKLPTIITNCSNNYGPFQFDEKLIPNTILCAINNEPITVYGNGMQIRDWLYVEDHVEALTEIAFSNKVGITYNIGGNNEKRNIEVIYSICEILDELKPKKKSYKSQITHVEDRPGHDLRYSIDTTKIYQDFKWLPKESFESGLRKTVKWYVDNN